MRGNSLGRSQGRARRHHQERVDEPRHRTQLGIIEKRGAVERGLCFAVIACHQVGIRDPFRLDTAQRCASMVDAERRIHQSTNDKSKADEPTVWLVGGEEWSHAHNSRKKNKPEETRADLASASSLVSISSSVTFLYGRTEKLATTEPLDDASISRPDTCRPK